MKNKLFFMPFCLLLCGMAVSCNQYPKDSVAFEGEIDGVADSSKVNLFVQKGDVLNRIAEVYIVNGTFDYVYTPDSLDEMPLKMVLYGMNADSEVVGMQTFYAANGLTKVKGEGNSIFEWQITNKTAQQKDLNKINTLSADAETIKAYKETIYAYYLLQKARDVAGMRELNGKLDSLMQVKYKSEVDWLSSRKKYSDVYLGELLAALKRGIKYDDFLEPQRASLEAIYAALTPEQKSLQVAQEINSILFPPEMVGIGSTVPSVELFDTDGNSHSLDEFRGRYVLLDFWSSGCYPCIMAGNELKELHEQYADRLAVVSITTDETDVWKKATADHDITWNNFSDYKGRYNGFCSHFNFEGIPYFMIVDKDGVVVKEQIGYGKGRLKELLREFIEL